MGSQCCLILVFREITCPPPPYMPWCQAQKLPTWVHNNVTAHHEIWQGPWTTMKKYSMARLWPDIWTGNSREKEKGRSIVYRTYRPLTRWFSRHRAVNTLGLGEKKTLANAENLWCASRKYVNWYSPSEWATFQRLGDLRMQQYVTCTDIRAYWTGQHCTSMSGTAQ